jgi:hypothetical protein
MRILLTLSIVSVLALSACGRRENLIEAKTTITFVNQDDQSQVLELHVRKSVVLAIGHWLGIQKSITKAGSYTFNTARGITRGTFNWLDPEHVIRFRSDQSGEKDWSTSIQQDGSFRDQSGAVWRERRVRLTIARAQ